MVLFIGLSILFSYSSINSYRESKIKEISNKQAAIIQLVDQSITPILKTGVYSEVSRFCNKFKELESIKSISVKLFGGDTLCDVDMINKKNVIHDIYFSPKKKEKLAQLYISFRDYEVSILKVLENNYLKSSLLLFVFFIMFLFAFIYKNLSLPIIYIGNKLKEKPDTQLMEKPRFYITELYKINILIDEYKDLVLRKAENEVRDVLNKQVAHDIKSPLAALEIVMDDLKSLPEDTREITINAVNRIKGIANDLSKQKEKSLSSGHVNSRILNSITLMNIVNEKICGFTLLPCLSRKVTKVRPKPAALFCALNRPHFFAP